MADPEAVIFDLDGTLVQTRESSWLVFEPINRRHGLGIDEPEQFYELFAGNLFEQLRDACPDMMTADTVIAEFMAALDEHYEPAMIPGIVDVIKRMAPRSRLAVLSSNTTSVLRRVLRGNQVEYCFAHVFGGDVEPDKVRGIDRFLADAARGSGRLCHAYYDERQASDGTPADPSRVVLVTDTVGDIEAARTAGIRSIGVSWGMHTEEQLLAAGAEFVAIWPQELLSFLYSERGENSPGSCSSACETQAPGSTNALPEPKNPRVLSERVAKAAMFRRSRRTPTSTSAAGAPSSRLPGAARSSPTIRRPMSKARPTDESSGCGCGSASAGPVLREDPALAGSVGLIMSGPDRPSEPGTGSIPPTRPSHRAGLPATTVLPAHDRELTAALTRMLA